MRERTHSSDARSIILQAISRIEARDASITLTIDLQTLDGTLALSEPDAITLPIGAVRTARSVRLLIAPADSPAQTANPALLKMVAQAYEARAAFDAGGTFEEIADRLRYGREYLADLIRTSYLAPAIIAAIVEGRQPAGLTRKQLLQANRVPLGWDDQVRFFKIG